MVAGCRTLLGVARSSVHQVCWVGGRFPAGTVRSTLPSVTGWPVVAPPHSSAPAATVAAAQPAGGAACLPAVPVGAAGGWGVAELEAIEDGDSRLARLV